MEFEGICLNCFARRGEYEVCPYCGHVAGTPPREAYLLHPGTRLWGRYVIGTVLGIGGFGVTYRAWDSRLDAVVAIKEFFPQSLVNRIPGEVKVRVFSGDKQESYKQQLARFMDEAKNLAKFTGDGHIVSVLDFFEDNNTAYIVMEYLDGVTLKEYMEAAGGFLPHQQAMEITQQLLEALASIHQKGIIHRDISPDNIFILKDGSMKLLDFGAARFAAREDAEFTQSIVVKKGYAPPEQYRTNMKQGVWTDIYAAGATLYKMLTGITPEESIERYEKDTLARPSKTGTGVDAAVDKAIMKAMALRPELRFKTAADMQAALENRTVIDFPEEELKKRQRFRGVIIALAVLVVVGLGAMVGWQATHRSSEAPPSLADMDIEPDSITVFMIEDERRTPVMRQLVKAFMEKYPEHTVKLESVPYVEGMHENLVPRFLSEDAPAVFNFYPDIRNDEEPFMADLTPLYNALDMEDYVLLEQYGKSRNWDEEHPGIFDMPTGFTFRVVYANKLGAEERGLETPTKMPGWQELVDYEKANPGSVVIGAYEFTELLACLEPEIEENRDLDALKARAIEFADLYKQGYFRSYFDERENQYRYPLYTMGDTYGSNFRDRREYEGDFNMIPLYSRDTIGCHTNENYSVSGKVTENQQKVGMLFIHFMLSEYAQNLIHVQNDNTQPLNRAALEQYVAANPDFAFLTKEVIDELSYGRFSFYIENFYEMLENNTATPEKITAAIDDHYSYWNDHNG